MESICRLQLCKLIIIASEKGLLKKAVFSKSADKYIVKAVASIRTIGAERCIQAELFHSDNKATHKNFSMSEVDARDLSFPAASASRAEPSHA